MYGRAVYESDPTKMDLATPPHLAPPLCSPPAFCGALVMSLCTNVSSSNTLLPSTNIHTATSSIRMSESTLESAKSALASGNPPYPFSDLPNDRNDCLWTEIRTEYQLSLPQLSALKNERCSDASGKPFSHPSSQSPPISSLSPSPLSLAHMHTLLPLPTTHFIMDELKTLSHVSSRLFLFSRALPLLSRSSSSLALFLFSRSSSSLLLLFSTPPLPLLSPHHSLISMSHTYR
jgi:hypothetical protein